MKEKKGMKPMKIRCPKCNSRKISLFDPTFDGSLLLGEVELKVILWCEDCEHDEKLYIGGKVDWSKKDLGEWLDRS